MSGSKYRMIGIMGGMGPATSAASYSRIIQLFQSELGARRNDEFPEILLHSVRSPDNVETGVGDELLTCMRASVSLLEQGGVDFIVIPCNSAHIHIEAVRETAKVPVLDIIEVTARVIRRSSVGTVLVLGTRSTMTSGLYHRALEKHGISVLTPCAAHQELLTEMIMAVCAGKADGATRTRLIEMIGDYSEAEGLVLGCTELPMLIGAQDIAIPCFDSAEILARAAFSCCTERVPAPLHIGDHS